MTAEPKLSTQDIEDQRYMMAAVRLARRNMGRTGSNPSVACLIVAGKGDERWIAGRGVTAIDGRPHAEPIAIEEAGDLCKGATAYVTLEPCSHHATTPPCSNALINAGITRVVTAQLDPDGRVNGKGHDILSDAGLSVTEGICTPLAEWGLRAYRSRKTSGRPWTILKLAVTADGYLGLKGEGQVAITGPVANAQTHLLRARCDAILVGSGTVASDDPALTCRLEGREANSPQRIILENSTCVSNDCGLFNSNANAQTILVCPQDKAIARHAELADKQVEILGCESNADGLDLADLLQKLGKHEISSLLLEGGKDTATRFLQAGLVDEILMYISREKMADKVKAKSNAHWIHWPAAPAVIPDGFHIAGNWQWGTDKAVRMVRDEKES